MTGARSLAAMGALVSLLWASSSPAAPPAADPIVLALIVTNNRGTGVDRPDLRYADDDGAKYYELFRTLADAPDVILLTELDRDTQRLFPALSPEPPTLHAVDAAVARLSARAAAARRSGVPVQLYFIFAGHGDIAGGRGILSLRDGTLDGDGLEQILRRINPDRAHVILDSCNSFFVLSPRKPGGRRFATPADAADRLAHRLPNVGVFLSTSAEGEVFEWSELQGGIFSHAVRSGLAGAADVDGDGRVSYAELEAFVATATAEIKNPRYRPTVFARGPDGNGQAPVISWSASRAATLRIEAGRRVTVRDRDELPWFDAHTDAQAGVTLHLPSRLSDVTVEERDGAGTRHHFVGALHDGAMTLAAAEPPAENARGAAEIFEHMFAQPFGRRALADYWVAKEQEPPLIIGVAHDDITRMQLLVGQAADADRARRLVGMSAGIAAGAAVVGDGIWQLTHVTPSAGDVSTQRTIGGISIGVGGGVALVSGLVGGLRRSEGERLAQDLNDAIHRSPEDLMRTMARIDEELERMRRSAHAERSFTRVVSAVAMGLSIATLAFDQTQSGTAGARSAIATVSGALLVGSAGTFAATFFETPLERIARLWREDPALGASLRPTVGIGATLSSVSLWARF